MENENKFNFKGKGSFLFTIDIVNFLLMLLTLGLYYPWAKEKRLKYVLPNLFLGNGNFNFAGTGREIFSGFIKTYLFYFLFLILYAASCFLIFYGISSVNTNEMGTGLLVCCILGFVMLLGLVFIFLPFYSANVIFSTMRYECARISWNGILMNYRIIKRKFIKPFVKEYCFFLFAIMASTIFFSFFFNLLLSGFVPVYLIFIFSVVMMGLIILSTYTFSRLQNKIYSLTLGGVSLGNAELNYNEDNSSLFEINLIGWLLSFITFGVGYFWYKKDLYNYLIKNFVVHHNGREYQIQSAITVKAVFKLEFINVLLLIFTLGFAFSWVYCRNINFLSKQIILPPDLKLDKIKPVENVYINSKGKKVSDVTELGGLYI